MTALEGQLHRLGLAHDAPPDAMGWASFLEVVEATYRAALKTIVAFDRREALAQIHVPTLLLAAEHDRTAPPDMMQRMARRIGSRAQYVCLADAGHIANVEAPAAFNAAVLRFLDEHFAGT